MMKKLFYTSLLILLLTLFFSCGEARKPNNTVIVGISADVETINPLYAFSVDEGNITELLFLSPVKHRWDSSAGTLTSSPMLAERWEWISNTRLKLYLRTDVYWSDGSPCTSDDIIFSFDAYSDPQVGSRFYGYFENFYTDEHNHIILEETFEKAGDYELTVSFKEGTLPSLLDIDMPVMHKKSYEGIERSEYKTADVNFNPVSNGPFTLAEWRKDEAIVLNSNNISHLTRPGGISKLIFKIIPEYTSRISQLTTGEIDLMEEIQPGDASMLSESGDLIIQPIGGREYDYIGYNHFSTTDPSMPNVLFSDAKVRKAITHSLNRNQILEEYLHNYGKLASTPISSIFGRSYLKELTPIEYNPESATSLLAEAGWKDNDGNGVIDKKGQQFKFWLHIPSGNPRRSYAATVIKNNLKEIGVEMNIVELEMGIFLEKMYTKQFDAWMVGAYIPIPIHLKSFWYSDPAEAPANFTGYSNEEIDTIIEKLGTRMEVSSRDSILKKFQEIIFEDQPVSFLYWIDNITAHNSRIKNMSIDPLGFIHYCWEWEVE